MSNEFYTRRLSMWIFKPSRLNIAQTMISVNVNFRHSRHHLQRRVRLGVRRRSYLRYPRCLVQSWWQACGLDRVQRHRGWPHASGNLRTAWQTGVPVSYSNSSQVTLTNAFDKLFYWYSCEIKWRRSELQLKYINFVPWTLAKQSQISEAFINY